MNLITYKRVPIRQLGLGVNKKEKNEKKLKEKENNKLIKENQNPIT